MSSTLSSTQILDVALPLLKSSNPNGVVKLRSAKLAQKASDDMGMRHFVRIRWRSHEKHERFGRVWIWFGRIRSIEV